MSLRVLFWNRMSSVPNASACLEKKACCYYSENNCTLYLWENDLTLAESRVRELEKYEEQWLHMKVLHLICVKTTTPSLIGVFLSFRYLKEFRTEQCPLFVQHKCTQHRPFSCFHWHFLNQRRRRPIRRRDGTFNYSPDVYCTKYDEGTGTCPDGDEWVQLTLKNRKKTHHELFIE